MNQANTTGWKWRDGELVYREFIKLNEFEKQKYVLILEELDEKEISSTDEIILNRYSKKKSKHFFTLD